jgi:hypothetical protein
MVARPMAPEAVKASHRPRRNPRHGVRASCSRRARMAGSSDSRPGRAGSEPAMVRPQLLVGLNASFSTLPV